MKLGGTPIEVTGKRPVRALRFDAKQSQGFVVLCPALGVRKEYYVPFALHLQSCGYSTVLFDYTGIGASVLEYNVGALDWAEGDAAAVIRFTLDQAAQLRLPVHGIGHSFGGCCFGLSGYADELTSLTFVASQTGFFCDYPFPFRLRLILYFYILIPVVVALVGYFPSRLFRIGEDLPPGVATEWARWCRSPNYLADHLSPVQRARYDGFKGTLLSLYFDDDPYANDRTVTKMAELYGSATSRSIRRVSPDPTQLPHIGHFGFFRRRSKHVLWSAVLEFFGTLQASPALDHGK